MTVSEYNKCVDEFADGLYRFILKNLKDNGLAEDIVQDTFEKLWLKVNEVDFAKAKSYIYTIGYNAMIDRIRKDKRLTVFEETIHDREVNTHKMPDLKKIINKALNTLSDIQKHVILLRDYEGYSYAEIGEITGLNESQVKVYLHRARLNMKAYLGSLDNVV
ncbi:MAG: RNA polymerase sigma factor [Bacteroidia bacterium]